MKNKYEQLFIHIYFLLMAGIFPLFFTNYYYNIQLSKSLFFIISTLIALMFFIVFSGYKKIAGLSALICKIPAISHLFILFGLYCLFTSFLSPYMVSSITGDQGRYCGSLLILCMCICCVLFTTFPISSRISTGILLFSGVIIEISGILNAVGIALPGFADKVPESLSGKYLSTIGNINFFSCYVSLITAFCIGNYMINGTKSFLLFSFTGFFALFAGNSDGGFLGIFVVFILVPCFFPFDSKHIQRLLDQLITFSVASIAGRLLSPYLLLKYHDIPSLLSQSEVCLIMLCTFLLLRIIMTFLIRSEAFSHRLKIWYLSALSVLCISVMILFALNELQFIHIPALRITNRFGNNRGFIWRTVLSVYEESPAIHKLFGWGPDTLKIVLKNYRYQEMLDATHKIYDSAHNEFLHYLITIGIIGALLWLSCVIGILIRALKSKETQQIPWLLVFMAYLIQSLIMPIHPFITPFVYMIAGICIEKSQEHP